MYNSDLNNENQATKDINVVPNEDTYECPDLKIPLFQIEDQRSSENNLKHVLWWKTQFHAVNTKLIKIV